MCSTNKEFGSKLCEVGERVSRGRLEQISVEKEAEVMRCSAREREKCRRTHGSRFGIKDGTGCCRNIFEKREEH